MLADCPLMQLDASSGGRLGERNRTKEGCYSAYALNSFFKGWVFSTF